MFPEQSVESIVNDAVPTETFENTSAALPVLVTVIVWAMVSVPTVVLGNESDSGETETVTTFDAVAVPVRFTTCGLPAALSAMLIVPVLVPATVGVKVTCTVQNEEAVSVAGQLLVWE